MPSEAPASSVQEQEFKDWQAHPVTRRLTATARARLEAIKDEWASGQLTAESHDGTLQRNAMGIARCREMTWLLELDYTDLYEEMESATKPNE